MRDGNEHEQLRRSWIANADAWRDAVRERSIASRRMVTDAAIVEAILALRPRTLLDLGCGEGWLPRAVAPHGIEVIGVDASAPLIDAAHALGGGRFVVADYDELANGAQAIVGASVEAIVANFSLLDDRAEPLLRALAAVLADRGTLLVQTVHPLAAGAPYADGWRTETFTAFEGEWREPMPWYFRTIGSWSRVFANAGYAIARIDEPAYPDGAPASLLFSCRVI